MFFSASLWGRFVALYMCIIINHFFSKLSRNNKHSVKIVFLIIDARTIFILSGRFLVFNLC